MADVLVLTRKDLSNMAWRTAECIRMLGLDVLAYKGHGHMNYPDQCQVIEMISVSATPLVYECKALKKEAGKAKVLHFTSGTFIDTGVNIQKKNVVFQYGGRPYIGSPWKRRICTKFANKFVNYTIVHHPCFLNKGAKNDMLIKPPVDTELLQPVFKRSNPRKVIIGHFPSNEIVKGTKIINEVIAHLKSTSFGNKFEYVFDTSRVGWNKQLERLKECDVIIECITPTVKGDAFGEWSTAAMESAALGKITVTNSVNENIYAKYYGRSQFVIANDGKQLTKKLKNIINFSDEKLRRRKIKTRNWIVEKHSMEATARVLWDKVYKHIFPDHKPDLIHGK